MSPPFNLISKDYNRKRVNVWWQVRSNLMSTAKLFDEIREHITDKRVEMMKNTTFGGILMAYMDGRVTDKYHRNSKKLMIPILDCYNKNDKTFKFDDKRIRLQQSDVSKIFGLTMAGEKINLKLNRAACIEDEFVRTWFKGENRISKTHVEKLIRNCVKGTSAEDDSDFVRLICIHVCTTLLFPSSAPFLPWCILKYIADLSNINSFNWSEAVIEFLSLSLDRQSTRGLSGCAILLPFWVCEESNWIQPRDRKSFYPKFVRWDLVALKKEIKKIKSQMNQVFKDSIENLAGAHADTGENQCLEVKPKSVVEEAKVKSYVGINRRRPMRTCKRKSYCGSDKEGKKKKEITMNKQKAVKHPEIIDVDDEAMTVKPRKSKVDKNINISAYRVSKFLDNQVIKKLQEYCDSAKTGDYMWQSDESIGGLSQYFSKKDLYEIMCESAIASNVLDSYAQVVISSQLFLNSGLQTHIITSMCMDFLQRESKSCIQNYIYNQVLEYLGNRDLIFFPLSHPNWFHFTLLVLNKKEQVWNHYNTLLPRKKSQKDPAFEEARSMHALVQSYLKEMKENADILLRDGMIQRAKHRGPVNDTVTEEKLTENEKMTLTWLKDANIDFPISPSFDCPQQKFGSLDCGPAVLFLMEELCLGNKIPKAFSEDCMLTMRANILAKFVNDDKFWKQPT